MSQSNITSETVIANFLKDPDVYGTKNKLTKQINLDGPDSSQWYWHDEDILRETFTTRHMENARSNHGMECILAPALQVAQGRPNPARCIGMLEQSSFFTEGARLCGEAGFFNRIMLQFHSL